MDKRRRSRWIVAGAIVGGLVMLGTIGGDGGAIDSVIGTAVLAAWIIGVVRLFQGGHHSLGMVAVFIPGVFVAGYFVWPKPGTSAYLRAKPEQQRLADHRWPMEAVAYRKAVYALKTPEERAQEMAEAHARLEIDRDIPPPPGY
jgi:hypothetical protein